MSRVLDYDSTPEVEPYIVKKGGVEYELREPTEKAAVNFRNNSLRSFTLHEGKPAKIDGLASVDPALVSDCLFFVAEPTKNVPLATILNWPAAMVKELAEKCKEMGKLNEGDKVPQEALQQALNLPDSPVSYDNFSNFVSSLPDKEYKSIKDLLLSKSDEESAKN